MFVSLVLRNTDKPLVYLSPSCGVYAALDEVQTMLMLQHLKFITYTYSWKGTELQDGHGLSHSS